MPTILINTNLNNKNTRYKDKNETTTPVNNDTTAATTTTTTTTTTAEAAAAATSSGDGGSSSTSTSNDGGEANSDASYDMDAEFRKDLNTIITKLLNKSQTMESFTIKYDIEDLMLTTNNKNDTNNRTNNNNNCETHCICHRMARLFNDLLNNSAAGTAKTATAVNGDESLPNSQSSGDTNINSITLTSSNSLNSAAAKTNDVHLESIYKELKLLRKYQFDLDSKFNLLLNQFNTSNRLSALANTSARMAMGGSSSSSTLTNNSHPFGNLNIAHPTVSPTENRIKYSSSASLTGAKKRKFNSSRLIPSGTNINISTSNNNNNNKNMISTNSMTVVTVETDSEERPSAKSPTSNHVNSSRSASASSSSSSSAASSSLSTHSSKSLSRENNNNKNNANNSISNKNKNLTNSNGQTLVGMANTSNKNDKSPTNNVNKLNSLMGNDKRRHTLAQASRPSNQITSHRNTPTSHGNCDLAGRVESNEMASSNEDYLMKSEKFESEEATTINTNDELNDHDDEDDIDDEENSNNVNKNNETSNETNEPRQLKQLQQQSRHDENENENGKPKNNNDNDEDIDHIENDENEPDPDDENEFDNDLVDELEVGDAELDDDDDECLEDDAANKTDMEFGETFDDMDEPGCYAPSTNATKSQLHHRAPNQQQHHHHQHRHHQNVMAAASTPSAHHNMTQLVDSTSRPTLMSRNNRNTSLSSALNLAQNQQSIRSQQQQQQQAAMAAAAYLNYQNQLNNRQSTFSSPQNSSRMVHNKSFDQMNVNPIQHQHHHQPQLQPGFNRSLPAFQKSPPTPGAGGGQDLKPPAGNYPTTSYLLQQQPHNQPIDIDLNELFKGNGPKYLQMDNFKNFKPPIVKVNDTYYVEDTMAALSYSKSKSRRNFAAHLTKLVFTPRERLESNCNGRFGKKALDSARLLAIRNTIFKYYPCKQSTVILNGDKITSGDHDENSVWVRDCIPAIDESNRVLKKQLVAWYKKNHPDKFPALAAASSNNPSTSSNAGNFSQNAAYNTKNEYQMSSSSSSEYYGQYQNSNNDIDQDFEEFEEQD